MAEKIPPEVQTQLIKLQQLQKQLDNLTYERSVIDSELREINKILEELSKLSADTPVYKIVGNILVRKDKASIEQELNDRKEILELRSRTYLKQESLLRKQFEDLQKNVNDLLQRYYPQLKGSSNPPKA
ncbi:MULTISPECIES: prefoldin subunit beta [Acidianus]|uniref:Prefoldin subunit beta n=3 Tax=Acidianus TaxID=12914 RepID=A0A650CXQ9_ACIAM|nr:MULTISPECIES: prefoldin subunit beta [Acidianus]MCY0883096.1 prefoldin subunit beta [Acidianus infernus]MDT7900495.1 prefoldin subunit beta [Acidianus sp.]AEE93721.1 prefoldin, beta subunit [Acidianus hospitalis W1]MQL54831.1 prefoldin subunit beta [Acidianus ambivalens]MUM64443.1 prefoldin subunit beta [Acidianus infernus]